MKNEITELLVVLGTVLLSMFCIYVHPEPFQAIRKGSRLRALKITTVGGKYYWQIQKKIPMFNKWINAVDDMSLWYDGLKFDNPKDAIEFIENHYAIYQAYKDSKPVKRKNKVVQI